jgi:hypothetical protein
MRYKYSLTPAHCKYILLIKHKTAATQVAAVL